MADQVQITKLVFSNIGDPKKALANMPENEKDAVTGYIMGVAADMYRIERARTDGSGTDIYVGLKGTFEGMSTDNSKDSYTSGICYMPEAFILQMFQVLFSEENGGKPYKGNPYSKEGFEAGTPGKPIKFAAEVGIMRASNPQGYSWRLRPVGDVQKYDPLADLREAIRGDRTERKQITGGTTLDLKANDPAPQKSPAKVK